VGEVGRGKARGEGDPWREREPEGVDGEVEGGANACRGSGDVRPRSTGEGRRGEGEEPECPDEIGGHGRSWMGAAVMRRRSRAQGR
jgi:hypothetical protein